MSIHVALHHVTDYRDDRPIELSSQVVRLVFPDKSTRFKLTVDLVGEMAVYNPFDFFLEPSAETVPLTYASELREEQRTLDFVVSINQKLQSDMGYLIRMEPGVQTPEESLSKRSGSCRDSVWLLVQLLRHLARFFRMGHTPGLMAGVQPTLGVSAGHELPLTLDLR